jgi:DNA-binding response OmpR family regulator/EAL domain-containing protein (putative c-di-GMP-specific phosphodiesterase class I)
MLETDTSDRADRAPDRQRQQASGDRALRQKLEAFAGQWRDGLSTSWDGARASLLNEELERLTGEADAIGLADVAEPALELTVFLCSFVESGVVPSPAQRQALLVMVERLVGAPAAEAPRVPKKAVAKNTRGLVHYLRPPGREIESLAPYLGSQRFLVRPFEDVDALIGAFAESLPDVLVVDDAFVPKLHALAETAARARQAQRDPPLCLVLSEAADPARVLFAQRAGADAVVSSRDPVAILARIDEALEQRRHLGYRVLVVEDDPSQSKFCESILHHRGITTAVCATAAEVVPALQSFHPDLVLLDFYLPDGNGIEVAQAIRAEPGFSFLPVVFLSGEQDLDRRFDAISMGGDDFLTKPVKPRHLLMTVDSRVRRARTLGASVGASRGERRGILASRETFLQELEHVADAGVEACAAIVHVAVDGIDALRDRVGFVAAGTLSQQISAALAAELPFARPLCAYGDYAFLALAQRADELALRDALEDARDRLAARAWLSGDDPLKLSFTLTAQRIVGPAAKAESLIRRVRAQLVATQAAGGNACALDLRDPNAASEDPRVRLVRAVLRGAIDKDTSVVDYQPLVPLTGNLGHQYVARMRLKPPRSSQEILIGADEYLPLAQSQGLATLADRRLIRLALRDAHDAGQSDLRVLVRVSADSILDGAFAPWLAAELRSQELSAGVVALDVSAHDLIQHLPSDAAIEAVQRVGARLCLTVDDASDGAQRWLQHAAFGLVRFETPGDAAGWSNLATRLATARSLGKIVIASGVEQMQGIGDVLKHGVHYAHGAALCDWLPGFGFDFSHAVL